MPEHVARKGRKHVALLAAQSAELQATLRRVGQRLRTGAAAINIYGLDGPAPSEAVRVARVEARNAELEQVVAGAQSALPEGDLWHALLFDLEDGTAELSDEQARMHRAALADAAEDERYRALLAAANAGDDAAYDAAYDAIQAGDSVVDVRRSRQDDLARSSAKWDRVAAVVKADVRSEQEIEEGLLAQLGLPPAKPPRRRCCCCDKKMARSAVGGYCATCVKKECS